MLVLNTFNKWLMHKISIFIKTKWYNQNLVTREKYLDKVNSVLFLFEPKLVNNRSICDQLVVLHESEHYLAVNKHHDLIFNTDPPDTRQVQAQLWYLTSCSFHGSHFIHLIKYTSNKSPQRPQPTLSLGIFLPTSNKFSSLRLSLYEQIGHRYPHLVQPKLVHGFYVAHRLDFSTVNRMLILLYCIMIKII